MAGRRVNLALIPLLAGAVATGVAMFGVGSAWNAWPTVLHGALGLAIVAAAPWKSAISSRSARRRGVAASLPSLALALTVAAALVTGFLHRVGLRDLGLLLVMQIHVTAAVVSIPLAVWHMIDRPVRPRRADLDRRAFFRAGLVGGGATVLTVSLPHAGGRTTRSLERGSHDPAAMPVTQWFDDDVPSVDGERWRLVVGGRAWSLPELRDDASDEVTAVLDCTGGWYAVQRWRGVRLDRLLASSRGDRDGASVLVRSVTGYWRRFPLADAPSLLVATEVEGEPLSPGHGFPARLVAPNRRGFWWVKWMSDVRVDDRPWWWQPPFPLT